MFNILKMYITFTIIFLFFLKEWNFKQETRIDTSNYELDRPLLKVKHRKVIGLMKDELGFCRIETKNIELFDRQEWRKQNRKGLKSCVIKKNLKSDVTPIETCTYWTSKDLVFKKNKCNNIVKQYKNH